MFGRDGPPATMHATKDGQLHGSRHRQLVHSAEEIEIDGYAFLLDQGSCHTKTLPRLLGAR